MLIIEQVAYTCQRARPSKKTERVVASPPPSPIRIQPNIVGSLAIDTEVTPLLRVGEGNAVNCKQCRREHARHTQAEVGDTKKEGDGKGVGKGVERKDEATSPGGLRAVFLGLALAVHSVLEGLAFGLIESENDVGPRALMCT